MITILIILTVVLVSTLLFAWITGTAPDFLKSYHIYKYKDRYFVKIKIFVYITLRYVDADEPLRHTHWGVSDLKHCLVNSKQEAEDIIATLKETATEIK